MVKMVRYVGAACLVLASQPAVAQTQDNSNLWPVHRDTDVRFRISYPPQWVIVPTRGANVRFSVNPHDGPGNCNVVARPNAALGRTPDAELRKEVEALPQDHASWAEYIGLPPAQVVLLESRRGRIIDVPALIGIVETALENLEGKFVRKAMVALTLRSRMIWTLNCGVSTVNADAARTRFAELQPTFGKVFGSFAFLSQPQ